MDDAAATSACAPLPPGWPEPEALGFGAYLCPLLVNCEHDGAGWSAPQLLPRGEARLAVASGALQYGLSVFEGLKAYRAPGGGVHLFRPLDHARRLAASARRLRLPELPEELFLQSCRLAVQAHLAFLPPAGRGSLYLRPTLHADEESLGLKAATRHRYTVTVTPCSDPPLKSLRLWAEPELIRAAPGGLGAAKTGANYAHGLGGLLRAREQGYDDVIWLDAARHQHLGEAGTMNLFVQIGTRLYTPPLDGTILAGVTRDCLLRLAHGQVGEVCEAPLALDELRSAARRGALRCAFGSGTAARVAQIRAIGGPQWQVEVPDNGLPRELAARLKAVQEDPSAPCPEWRFRLG